MTFDKVEQGRKRYDLKNRKQAIIDRLSVSIYEANQKGVPALVGLPEDLKLRQIKESANHRLAIQRVLAVDGIQNTKSNTEIFELIQNIIQDITALTEVMNNMKKTSDKSHDAHFIIE